MASAAFRSSATIQNFARLRRWHIFFAVLFVLCWARFLFYNSPATDVPPPPPPHRESFGSHPPPHHPDWHKGSSGSSLGHSGDNEPKKSGSTSSFFKDILGYHKPEKESPSHSGVSSAKPAEYSIKPIVYVFPQFHAIPENDKFWGVNFTEWVNVQKVTVNKFGLETLRPTEDVGYYNLLDLSTRKRWTYLIKNSHIHGVVYHHYWFGYPVMDGALQAMLKDGHPDVPFMLNWANEPWTVRWDGADRADGTLLAQNYGTLADWKRHFDWMAPFFKHPNYIRVNGKVQFVIYYPAHMGDMGKRMFAAWRLWASQDPEIGGLDVIETKVNEDRPESRGSTDAINEFGFRSLSGWDATAWPQNPRPHRTFHRGAMVSWDNTPRHATNGGSGGTSLVFVHPKMWKVSMIELMRRIKSDPNPPGEENFLFINALNEWGEGNTLEPSVQWGDGFLRAFDEAKEYADKHIPWTPDLVEEALELTKEVKDASSEVDVCVVIRVFHSTYPWEEPWTLTQTLESLRAMKNKRWRGVIARVLPEVDKQRIQVTHLEAYEPRLVIADVPDNLLEMSKAAANGAEVTDWVVNNMDTISPSCGGAKYLLITNSTTKYEPDSFDAAATESGADIIGLNFESKTSIDFADAPHAGNFSWEERCERFEQDRAGYCQAMTPEAELLDLGAALVSMKRWRQEHIELATSAAIRGEASVLRRLAKQPAAPWTWAPPAVATSASCHLIHAHSRTSCLRSGRLWADLPDAEGFNSGCYGVSYLQHVYPQLNILETWDYPRYKKDPFCIRLSRSKYEEVTGRRAAP